MSRQNLLWLEVNRRTVLLLRSMFRHVCIANLSRHVASRSAAHHRDTTNTFRLGVVDEVDCLLMLTETPRTYW